MVISGGTGTLARADRRRGARRDDEERRERLYRALEPRARRDLRRDRRLHARGLRARHGPPRRWAMRSAACAPCRAFADGRGAHDRACDLCGLSKSFGGLRVTADVTSRSRRGERRLIIGPNGAGKTTLFNLITGELAARPRLHHLLGRDVTRLPSRTRAHLGLARTYQIITLFPRDTLLHNVAVVASRACTGCAGTPSPPWRAAGSDRRAPRPRSSRVGLRPSRKPAARRDLLWRAAAGRDRHGAGAESQGAAARRAFRRPLGRRAARRAAAPASPFRATSPSS